MQTKSATGQLPTAGQAPRQPVAPPVYRPQPKKIVQPKMAQAAPTRKPPTAPPSYRPQPTPKVLQAKRATPHTGSLQASNAPRVVQAQRRTPGAPAPAASNSSRASVVQRVRSAFKPRLPPGLDIDLPVDDMVPQQAIDSFVDKLTRKQMGWYEDDDPQKDTKQQVLYNSGWQRAVQQNPFGSGVYEVWQCPNCHQPSTYSGIDLGHIVNWQPYLKKAGVTDKAQAIAAYNDINNLRPECGTCNRGHAFEQDDQSHYLDVPLKSDFSSSKEGKEQYARITQSYVGQDMDNYDMTDPFIDDSNVNPQEDARAFKMLREHFGGTGQRK
ncbi:MAG TPA: GH-E family nuclease [Pyrinomonadaceae bacterium]|nr:GH-E family nuclease [Pyrinomonadaceae bacterium]